MLDALEELRRHPSRAWVLVVCVAVAVLHQALRWDWFIDDAAICFAYARNLATGEGAVPWPGAERIEAISDPTWVAILTGFHALGLDGFTIAKPLAMLFTGPTLVLTWMLARRALPEHEGPGALVAPMVLAINAQFAIWSASGLENGLFCLILAFAMWRTVVETERGGAPWAAVGYLALAWTRPEGVLYAAVGGLWFLVGSLRAGRGWRPVAVWLGVFWIPSLLLEAARLAYFAWPVPNTYWAKIDNRGVTPLSWNGRGWFQLREWGWRLWHVYFVPIYVIGLTGSEHVPFRWGPRVRQALALGVLLILGALTAWPSPPGWVVSMRVVGLIAAAFLLPLIALGTRGDLVRTLTGQTLGLGLVWAVVADGDWMGAYRWMSLVSVPGSVLLAAGIVHVADGVQARISGSASWDTPGWVTASFLVGILLSPNASQTRDHLFWNRNETTTAIKARVDHTRSMVRRTFWDEPVINLEVDQGAHLWWAPDYHEVDMAMLVDVPMGRHWYQQRAFIQEWVFEENPPTFAHVGGWWAKHTGLRRYPRFWDDYIHLPPHQDPRFDLPFVGVFARRSLVMQEEPGGPGPRIPLDDGVTIEGVRVPVPAMPGGDLYLEVPLSLDGPRGGAGEIEIIAFLVDDAGQEVRSARLHVGYKILSQAWFRPGEVFRGRHVIPLPVELPVGTYDLGLLVRRVADREVLAPQIGGVEARPTVRAEGELRFGNFVRVVARDEMVASVDRTRASLRLAAAAGRCEEAEAAFVRVKRHHARAWSWHEELERGEGSALASCWAHRAEREPDRAVDHLTRAHRWDHHSPELRRVGAPLGEQLLSQGKAARAAEDWETAYQAFAALLRFQPWRSWARRWAEEARDHRLGLIDDVRVGIGGDDNLRRVRGE